jgi:predicted transcriptional regulator
MKKLSILRDSKTGAFSGVDNKIEKLGKALRDFVKIVEEVDRFKKDEAKKMSHVPDARDKKH